MFAKVPLWRSIAIFSLSLILSLAFTSPDAAIAETPKRRNQPFPQAPGPVSPKVKATIFPSSGQVVDILPFQMRLIVKCAPLKALGWLRADRNFPVADKSLLESLKKGDRIDFDLRFEGEKYVIVDIDKIDQK
jgi:Cu(I)/Ag(I) efflux system protein CusF